MHRFFSPLIILATLATARADLVVQQKIEGAGQTGTVTTLYLKGMKLRVDIPSRAGPVSSIVDMETGDSMTLMHWQRAVTKKSGSETRRAIDVLRKKAGKIDPVEAGKFEATGRKEKVGEFNAEIFVWKGAGNVETIWVTKDLPNYLKVKEQFDRLSKSATADLQKGLAPDMTSLPGVVVKTELERNAEKFTSTVLSVKEDELNPALFEVPVNYRDKAANEKTEAPSDAAAPAAN